MESPAKRRWRGWVAAAICWVCLLLMIGFVVYLRTMGDRAQFPTILIFSPRLVFAIPVVLLLPTAVYRPCWLPLVLLIATSLFPLMGLCIGWNRLTNRSVQGQPLRLVTFNLHQLDLGSPPFKAYLKSANADVLAFEEMPDRVNRRDFPPGLTHITRHGQLCVASRYPIHTIRILADEAAIRYTIDTPAGPVDLIGVHLSSPHWALRDSIDGADQGPEELARNIRQRGEEAVLLKSEIEQTTNHPLIIAGDFNLTPDSPLFTDNFSAMSDAYQSTEFGFGWSYFHQHTMVRIDHVLTSGLIVARSCVVGPALGSPHRPLVVDLILPRQKG